MSYTGCYWWRGDAGSCIQVVFFVWVLAIWYSLRLVLWWSRVLESVLPFQRLRAWSLGFGHSFFFFWTGGSIYWWVWLRREQSGCSWVQGPPFVQGTTIRDVLDRTAVRDESLFCHHVLKFIRIELGKSPLLGDVDLLMARELELGLAEGCNHVLLVLQLGADGHYDLANVDPGHGALGLSKGATHTCLESRLRNSRPVMNAH